MHTWQMQQAKAHLAEVIRAAREDGPQTLTVHGKPTAVILSAEAYERLAGTHESLVAFMRRSPLAGDEEIVFERDRSLTREVEL